MQYSVVVRCPVTGEKRSLPIFPIVGEPWFYSNGCESSNGSPPCRDCIDRASADFIAGLISDSHPGGSD